MEIVFVRVFWVAEINLRQWMPTKRTFYKTNMEIVFVRVFWVAEINLR